MVGAWTAMIGACSEQRRAVSSIVNRQSAVRAVQPVGSGPEREDDEACSGYAGDLAPQHLQ